MLNEGDDQFVTDGIREYVADIIAGIENRFPNEYGSLLIFFDIFHLESLPDTAKLWAEYQDDDGMDELKTLVDHYSAKVLQGKSMVIRLESWLNGGLCVGNVDEQTETKLHGRRSENYFVEAHQNH